MKILLFANNLLSYKTSAKKYIEGRNTLAQIELWKSHENYENKVYVLPKHLDEKVARMHLGKIGVELDELTDAQSENLGITKEGPFKPEHYRY